MYRYTISLLCLLVICPLCPVYGQADFADMVTFGDSLTHNDFLWIYYSNPPDLYADDPMEAVFVKGSVSGEELVNYAIAGSESIHVGSQIATYNIFRDLHLQDSATLFGFEIGGNDILNYRDLLATYAPGEDPTADSVINRIINRMRADLAGLRYSHPDAQFILWTLPDVTLTPELWNELTAPEIENVQAHTERVNWYIRRAGRLPFVIAVDVYALMQEIIADPPVIFGHQLMPPPDYGDYDNFFADEIHPTAVGNALIANEIIELINENWGDDIPVYTEEELADLAHIPY